MELRACYFCGSPGEGLDTYPVVPDRMAGESVDGPDSVVLCPDCHAKLERVLAGALAALDVESDDVDSADPDRSEPEGGDVSGEITFDDAEGGDSGGDGVDAIRIPADADAFGTDDPGTDEPETTDSVGAEDTGGGAGIDVGPDPSSGSEDDPSENGAPSDDFGASEPTEENGADDDGEDGDGADDDGADASDEGASDGLRRLGDSGTSQYRKALRLLQNREFPMPRSDVIDVMGSAYGLRHDECERLVDFAVERGWLVDDGGTLRRD